MLEQLFPDSQGICFFLSGATYGCSQRCCTVRVGWQGKLGAVNRPCQSCDIDPQRAWHVNSDPLK